LAKQLSEKGKKQIVNIARNKKEAEILSSFADFVVGRDK